VILAVTAKPYFRAGHCEAPSSSLELLHLTSVVLGLLSPLCKLVFYPERTFFPIRRLPLTCTCVLPDPQTDELRACAGFLRDNFSFALRLSFSPSCFHLRISDTPTGVSKPFGRIFFLVHVQGFFLSHSPMSCIGSNNTTSSLCRWIFHWWFSRFRVFPPLDSTVLRSPFLLTLDR